MIEEKTLDEFRTSISRRTFLTGAGAALGGLAAGSVFNISMPKAEAAASLPLNIPTLDIEKVRQYGFLAYQQDGGCCIGAAKGLVRAILETPGYEITPWADIPLGMFKFGAGGINSWGTLCGALNGALAVINLAAYEPKPASPPAGWVAAYEKIGNKLMNWYTTNVFPSNLLDTFVAGCTETAGGAVIKDTYNYPDQPTSVANSPLCHTSVSIWVAEHNKFIADAVLYDAWKAAHPGLTLPAATSGNNLKKARCGKLSGDVAAMTAKLLNDWKAGTLDATVTFDDATAACMTCHTGTSSTYDNEQGKMTCGECHDTGNPATTKNAAPKCSKP